MESHPTCSGAAIASQRPSQPTPAPFVTRRSTIAFSAISLLAVLAFQAVAGGDTSGAGETGLIAALLLATGVVCGVVAWIAGVVLAARAGSMLWLFVAVLPIFPINSMMCAMFCPAGRGERRR